MEEEELELALVVVEEPDSLLLELLPLLDGISPEVPSPPDGGAGLEEDACSR